MGCVLLNHLPFYGVFVTQIYRSRGDVSGEEGLAYLGGTHGQAYRRHLFGRYHVEPETGGDGGYLLGSARIVTYPVVVAQQHRGAAETADNGALEVFLRGETGKLLGERKHLHPVHSQAFQKDYLLVQGIQKAKVDGIAVKNYPGMRPEGYYETLLTAFTGGGDESLYDHTVADMHTVEESGSDYSHFTNGKSWRWGRRAFFA